MEASIAPDANPIVIKEAVLGEKIAGCLDGSLRETATAATTVALAAMPTGHDQWNMACLAIFNRVAWASCFLSNASAAACTSFNIKRPQTRKGLTGWTRLLTGFDAAS